MSASEIAANVERRIAEYQREQEGWKADHDRAMVCFQMEDLLRFGLTQYQSLVAFDESWTAQVFREECPFDKGIQAWFVKIFSDWLKTSELVAMAFEKIRVDYRARGFSMELWDQFSGALRECRALCGAVNGIEVIDAVVALRDAAIDEHRAGKSVELRDFAD